MALANRLLSTPRSGRPPKILTTLLIIGTLLSILIPITVTFYADWLWFGAIDFRSVFNKVVLTRIALFFAFGLLAALFVGATLLITYKSRAHENLLFVDDAVAEARRQLEQFVAKRGFVLPLAFGVFAGFIGQQQWRVVQLFLNRQSFGVTDPQFGMDFGFYAFTLPMLRLMLGTVSILLVVSFFLALIGHYLFGGIRLANSQTGAPGVVTMGARIQLGITAGLYMILRALGYYLDRFDLLNNSNETFTGASYTDVHAVLPAKIILMVIAVLVAASFFSVIFLKDLRIPAVSTVLMLLSALVIGSAWPLMLEKFSVTPNRAEKESEYIGRNIEATRYAYGLTDEQVDYKLDWGAERASEEVVASDSATVSNIRLLDPEILSPTFTQNKQLKNFYGFPESLAMDRYVIDGELRDFVVAAREIDPNSLRENQRNWINRHTVYTHGNGFVAARANKVDEVARDVGSTRGGYPVYTVSDLQTTDEDAKKLGIVVDEPRIYYGPLIASAVDGADYAVVGSNSDTAVEYDTDNSTYTYQGKGGVGIGNYFNRGVFAARYGEINILLSERVNENSKILFDRDPRQRVHKVAPWMSTDSTTYPAVIDGRIKWIVDGYTTLRSLPYAQRVSMSLTTQDTTAGVGADNRAIVNDELGYIRNSVKAVVDAYDGSVELYEFDKNDPVLKAWEGVFPGTVKPKEEISDELMSHIRYPQDMFKIQRSILARYHVNEAREFFTNDRFWSVPSDPSSGIDGKAQPPFYVVAADAETGEPSFQLITPFRGLNRQYLAAHMAASSDPENYGKITVRVLPTNTQTLGPQQAQDVLMSSDQVARDQSLWKATTELKNGNLLTLPVGGSEILYVEPIYAQRKGQEDSAFPKLLRVLVSYNGQVGYAPTVSEALAQVGINPREAQDIDQAKTLKTPTGKAPITETPVEGDGEETSGEGVAEKPVPGAANASEAITAINEALSRLEAARDGSFEEYGRALDQLDQAVAAYQALNN
ncbi:UPF0182 family protein [Corynebacterium sp. ES2794-CONJ1]|uniref:UPF0182 family protein n=1 Tax=unclassified Corynebacterium TaxID=2624378 RepID=UPI00216A09AE|nr:MULTISPECIES: UPF0182 family protein [unclassified Corynebacterium]MCS4489450.1 UPF0182 family protein [Corynebacterium sp. ES2775-CONJ]MCU9518748.1 UPF0182 family protein [Corynebacterium sp. ES2794-CONJ1]